MAFEQNQIAGLGVFFVNCLTNIALSGTGMRQRYAKFTEAEAGETGAVEPVSGSATGAVADGEVLSGVVDYVADEWNVVVKMFVM